MNNTFRLILDAVLVVAIAVLFYLHFADKRAAAPAKSVASTTAVVSSDADTTDTEDNELPPADTAALTPAPAPSANVEKVAYVESSKLLDGYKGMQDARKSFEAKARGWEKQNQNMLAGFQAAVQKYQKEADGLTAEQRAATEQRLQAQQGQIAQQQDRLRQQAAEEEAKMSQQVLERVNKLIEKYGKDNGYKLILIAAPSGTIAYGRKDLDITDAVVKHLNAAYKRK
ncbi:OmpH family outer membrane protein [Hymenobacter sp. BT175]|uniref:OmpH family outer membrane protein n=1 Tax=Hymenobacter translucens TaxID=2886507 RepID=UPI001D0EDD11|nr:OmpH family outer membrane protein [Hymenobacter translucens]MCC2547760.1 OmpH family outer membrane protein [Hymenobacter translucens]